VVLLIRAWANCVAYPCGRHARPEFGISNDTDSHAFSYYKSAQGMSGKQQPIERMIHIGLLIREELARQERTPAWLARKINCERTNIYDIFERSSINTELLNRISSVLGYDFFAIYSQHLHDNTH